MTDGFLVNRKQLKATQKFQSEKESAMLEQFAQYFGYNKASNKAKKVDTKIKSSKKDLAAKETKKNKRKTAVLAEKVFKSANRDEEVVELLQDDDIHVLVPKSSKKDSAKPVKNNSKSDNTTTLGKRGTSDFMKENKAFISFNEDEYDDNGDKKGNAQDKQEAMNFIDKAFGDLKKHKKLKKEKDVLKGYKGSFFQKITDKQGKEEEEEETETQSVQMSKEEAERIEAPWMKSSTRKLENTLIRLHNEIIDFIDHVGPSERGQIARMNSIEE